ncbi:Serine arginine-rich splicing factor 2, partial [Stylosanthes scabra]|nr:Serine arginine-rich splicing factor 2 [Stylosanthes scabra]
NRARNQPVDEEKGGMMTVFADNLPRNTTSAWVWKIFGNEGRVVDVYVLRKVRHRNPLMFTFVRFADRRDAVKAIQNLDGWVVWGCRLQVSEERYRRDGSPKTENGEQG